MDWSQPWVQAGVRAIAGGLIAAGVVFFTAAGSGSGLENAGWLAGSAFFSYLATRAGVEGFIDQRKATAAP